MRTVAMRALLGQDLLLAITSVAFLTLAYKQLVGNPRLQQCADGGCWYATPRRMHASLALARQAPNGLYALRDGALCGRRVVEDKLQRLHAQQATYHACFSQQASSCTLI